MAFLWAFFIGWYSGTVWAGEIVPFSVKTRAQTAHSALASGTESCQVTLLNESRLFGLQKSERDWARELLRQVHGGAPRMPRDSMLHNLSQALMRSGLWPAQILSWNPNGYFAAIRFTKSLIDPEYSITAQILIGKLASQVERQLYEKEFRHQTYDAGIRSKAGIYYLTAESLAARFSQFFPDTDIRIDKGHNLRFAMREPAIIWASVSQLMFIQQADLQWTAQMVRAMSKTFEDHYRLRFVAPPSGL